MPNAITHADLSRQLLHVANIVLFGGFVLAFAGEMIFPRLDGHRPYRRLGHSLQNLLLWIFGVVVLSFALGSSTWYVLSWLQSRGFGVITMLQLPSWLSAIAAFLLFDLCDYFFHRLSHNVRWLWLMHAVHHSDPDVDVTTNLRQHPLHIVVTQLWKIVAAAAIGVPVWVFLIHEILVLGFAHLHHASIRWPRWIDPAFSWLVITPRMHWNHHSPVAVQTNSNYAVILSIWDRVLGTLTMPEAEARFGLNSLRAASWQNAWGMFVTPWRARKLTQL